MADRRVELLEAIGVRALAYTDHGDPAPILADEALIEARELAALAQQTGGVDLPIAVTLAWLSWFRHLVLPEKQSKAAVAEAVELFARVVGPRPDLVPSEVALQLALAGDVAIDPAFWSKRAAAAYHQSFETEDGTVLDDAIVCWTVALAATPAGHPSRASYNNYLAVACRTRFVRAEAGSAADLDAAIAYGEEAVRITPSGDAPTAMYLSNLGAAYRMRFGEKGDQADLDQSIAYRAAAVEAAPVGHPSRTLALAELGRAYRLRFEWTGAGADLEAAIEHGADAVRTAPPGLPDRADYLSGLGAAHLARFQWAGDKADLDAAVTYGEEAVEEARVGHPDRAMCLTNLGLAHRMRFEQSGTESDVNAAIQYATEALEAASPESPDRANMLSNLGTAYQARFDLTGALADVDEAITQGAAAVKAAPVDHPSRPKWLSNLGLAYQQRARLMWPQAELLTSIANWSTAAEANLADRASASVGMAGTRRAGPVGDLDTAIRYGTEAVETSGADRLDRATALLNLGLAHKARFDWDFTQDDRDAAIRCWRAAAASHAGTSRTRMVAAWEWGLTASAAGDATTAMYGYSTAVNLLPMLAWHGLDRAVREDHLESTAGLAGEAAASAIQSGRPDLAGELLEAGRSVLWSQLLQFRTDRSRLKEQHPQRASRLDELRIALEQRDLDSVTSTTLT